MSDTIELFYVGEDFAQKSGSAMGLLYEVGSYARYDWGFVQSALAREREVRIRPATDAEMAWAEYKLTKVLAEQAKQQKTCEKCERA